MTGDNHSLALSKNGEVYATEPNNDRLDLGDTANRNIFVEVGALSDPVIA
ncbi:MAG: hypothetical protein LBF86_07545 [Helicobacteraceae bacterium]|nr:hypothetical protein [Helicobacteraceae bacterium]